MSARTVRLVVVAVGVAGIAGMIVSSIADNADAALAFGLVLATAVVGLMLVTAVVSQQAPPRAAEELGAAVEGRVAALVAAGADEQEVRALVAEAVRLGRST
jgi:hypothetical protein